PFGQLTLFMRGGRASGGSMYDELFRKKRTHSRFLIRLLEGLQDLVEGILQFAELAQVHRKPAVPVRSGLGAAVGQQDVDRLLAMVSAGENVKHVHAGRA